MAERKREIMHTLNKIIQSTTPNTPFSKKRDALTPRRDLDVKIRRVVVANDMPRTPEVKRNR